MDTTSEVLDEIECCFIGPVDIFDHQDGGALGEDIEERGEERRALRLAIKKSAEWRCSLLGNVVKRAKRAGSKERLASRPQVKV